MHSWIALVFVLAFPASLGCDDAEAAFDCHQVCSRYESCIDSDYDVSECRDRCRDKAKEDDTWKDKADACESCIDDRSCTSATFACATECLGIVP